MIFEIWCEGYDRDGMRDVAAFLGEVEADSFQEACDTFYAGYDTSEDGYDSVALTIWRRQLFDNEEDARAAHG